MIWFVLYLCICSFIAGAMLVTCMDDEDLTLKECIGISVAAFSLWPVVTVIMIYGSITRKK
jgi:hypothetical protein